MGTNSLPGPAGLIVVVLNLGEFLEGGGHVLAHAPLPALRLRPPPPLDVGHISARRVGIGYGMV